MTIQFINSSGITISEQQSINEQIYSKLFVESSGITKMETYMNGLKSSITVYNSGTGGHLSLINPYLNENLYWIGVSEKTIYPNGNVLINKYTYGTDTILKGMNIHLEDSMGRILACGHKDETGSFEFDQTHKYYYDDSINSERELFNCRYDETSGEMIELYYNNFHLDDDGHEALVLKNTAGDIQVLMNLTGMSLAKATWYMSPEIIPNY